jgi:DNA repair photolyase
MESKTNTGLNLLKILTKARYPTQIVTKSALIADTRYIEAMKDNLDNLLLQISITTPSDNISKRIESGAPSTSKRFGALSKLIEEGFYTAVRINPLFPIYPDGTLTKLSNKSNFSGLALLQKAREKKFRSIPIFNLDLIEDIIEVFEKAPEQTEGKHTIIAGFVRLPFACVKWVSEALGWQRSELKKFFHVKRGNCYYYTTEEIRFYYEAIRELCRKANVPFSVCYDSEKNFETFRYMWANPKDCCNAVGVVKGFEKVFADCC